MEVSRPFPLVNVIIPVFNGSNYLAEAIESVFHQTYPAIELVVVDDGSTDDTWTVIQSFGDRVRGIHKENGGVASALNTGIRQARGEYIAWLSHDDLFLPHKTERQVHFLLEHSEFGGCYTDFEIIDAGGAYVADVHAGWVPAKELPRAFLKKMHINGSTTLIRKVCYLQAGLFNESLAHTQDMDMWLRISEKGELGYIPEVTLRFRSHPEQGSLKFGLQIEEEQGYFSGLLAEHGPEYFFPEIKTIPQPALRKATGINEVASRLWRYRRWPEFTSKLYRQSIQAYPIMVTRIRIALIQSWLSIFGNETESICLVRRARFCLAFDDNLTARQLSGKMLKHHPLRLDALGIWLVSWIPAPGMRLAKQVKKII